MNFKYTLVYVHNNEMVQKKHLQKKFEALQWCLLNSIIWITYKWKMGSLVCTQGYSSREDKLENIHNEVCLVVFFKLVNSFKCSLPAYGH